MGMAYCRKQNQIVAPEHIWSARCCLLKRRLATLDSTWTEILVNHIYSQGCHDYWNVKTEWCSSNGISLPHKIHYPNRANSIEQMQMEHKAQLSVEKVCTVCFVEEGVMWLVTAGVIRSDHGKVMGKTETPQVCINKSCHSDSGWFYIEN